MEEKEQGWYLTCEGIEVIGMIEERSYYITWDELPDFLLEDIKGDIALSILFNQDHEQLKKDGMVTWQDRNIYNIEGLRIKEIQP